MIITAHVGNKIMLLNNFRDVIRIPIYRKPSFDAFVGEADPIRFNDDFDEYKFVHAIGDHYFYAQYSEEYNNVIAHANIIT